MPGTKVFCFMLSMPERSAVDRLQSFRDFVTNVYHSTAIVLFCNRPVPVHQIDIDQYWSNALSLLSVTEIETANRFYRDINRRDYVFAHAILRLLLSMQCGVDSKEIRFATGKYGKPVLAFPANGVCFNLSYGDGLLVIALSESAVGLDIEKLRSDIDIIAISRRYFAAEEQSFMDAATIEEKRERFFWLWSRKEALIKAAGTGLDTLASFSTMGSFVIVHNEFGQVRNFFLYSFSPLREHSFAIAIQLFSVLIDSRHFIDDTNLP